MLSFRIPARLRRFGEAARLFRFGAPCNASDLPGAGSRGVCALHHFCKLYGIVYAAAVKNIPREKLYDGTGLEFFTRLYLQRGQPVR